MKQDKCTVCGRNDWGLGAAHNTETCARIYLVCKNCGNEKGAGKHDTDKPKENTTSFDAIIDRQLSICRDTLTNKAAEYATEDRLHNFKVAAQLQGITPRQALAGMMAKHTVSVYDMCAGGEYSDAMWDEKICDSINYLLLLRAMVEEERSKE